MAGMDPLPPMTFSQPGSLRDFEPSTFPSVQAYPPQHDYYFATPRSVLQSLTLPDLSSPVPLAAELTTLSLQSTLCPLCKGQKLGFTAYFHNTKIFSEPPHELLGLVEKSYLLRDRLKSLLVTYTKHEVEQDRVPGIEAEIDVWQREITFLVKDVICSAQFELDFTSLDKVEAWTFEMTNRFKEHIWERIKLDMPKGRLQNLMVEFRKAWEEVWKGFLRDRKISQEGLRKSSSSIMN